MALRIRVTAADTLAVARVISALKNSTSLSFCPTPTVAAFQVPEISFSCLHIPSRTGVAAVRRSPLFAAVAPCSRFFSRSSAALGSPTISSIVSFSTLPPAAKPSLSSSCSLASPDEHCGSPERRDIDRSRHGVRRSAAEPLHFVNASSALYSAWAAAPGENAGCRGSSCVAHNRRVLDVTATAAAAEAAIATTGATAAAMKARKAEGITPVTTHHRDAVNLACSSCLHANADATSVIQHRAHFTTSLRKRKSSVFSSCRNVAAAGKKQRLLHFRCMCTRAAGGSGGSATARHQEALLPFQKRLRMSDLLARKRTGEKISMVTAYDAYSAEILDNALIDMLLVGDSLANVIFGLESTAQIDFDTMLLFSKHVRRAARRAIVVFDFPYGSYHTTALAVDSAVAVVKQTGITTVKFEGFSPDTVKALSDHVNVICHLGVQPQTAESMASRGKKAQDAVELLEQSLAMEAAGCKMVLLEKVCAEVADAITARLKVPTIGIGSGPGCDGQVLVFHDLFGLSPSTAPFRFVKQYCQVHRQIAAAAAQYKQEVDDGLFPAMSHSFFMPPQEREKFFSFLSASAAPAATSLFLKGAAGPNCSAGKQGGTIGMEVAKPLQISAFRYSASEPSPSSSPAASSSHALSSSASAPAPAELIPTLQCLSSAITAGSGNPEGSLSLVQQWIRQGSLGPDARLSAPRASPTEQGTHFTVAGARATAAGTNNGSAADMPAVYASETVTAETQQIPASHAAVGTVVEAGNGEAAAELETSTIAENAGPGAVAPVATETTNEYSIGGVTEQAAAAATKLTAFVQKTQRIGIRGGGAMGQFLAYSLAGVPDLDVTLFTKRAELRAAALGRGGRLLMRRVCEVTVKAEEKIVELQEIGMALEEGRREGKQEHRSATAAGENDPAETKLQPQQGTAASRLLGVQTLPPGVQLASSSVQTPPPGVQTASLGVRTPLSGVQGRQVHVVIDEAEIPKAYFDAVIICTKSWQTKEAAAFALEKTAPGGIVVTVQNGLEAPRVLYDAFQNLKKIREGQQTQLQGKKHQQTREESVSLVFAPATYGVQEEAPGIALMTGEGDFRICAGTPSARIAAGAVAALLQRAGLKVLLGSPAELRSVLWSKAAVSACINPLTAVLRCPNGQLSHPALKAIRGRIALETVSVARARGIPLQREATEEHVETVVKNTAQNISSMLMDVLNGKRTEIDAINGEIVREAKKAGLKVPVVECFLNLVQFITDTSPRAKLAKN